MFEVCFWGSKYILHRIHGTGIYTYIYHKNQSNVGKYTIQVHGSYRYLYSQGFWKPKGLQRLLCPQESRPPLKRFDLDHLGALALGARFFFVEKHGCFLCVYFCGSKWWKPINQIGTLKKGWMRIPGYTIIIPNTTQVGVMNVRFIGVKTVTYNWGGALYCTLSTLIPCFFRIWETLRVFHA